MIFRKPIAVCRDKVIAKRDDVIDRKLGRRVGVEHSGVIDMLALEGSCRFYCEELGVDIGHIHCGELYGESADDRGLDAEAAYKTRNFYAGVGGKV